MAQINLTNAKKLCTAAEFRVVQASNPSQVNQFSADALKKHTVEARRLRDKWRDLAHRQLRQVRQSKGVRSADDSNRTAKKAELFAKVLARFEGARPGTEKTTSAAKPTKASRSAGHRQTRASVREALSEQTSALRAKSKTKSSQAFARARASAKKERIDAVKGTSALTEKQGSSVPPVPATGRKKNARKPSSSVSTSSIAGPQKALPRFGKQLAAKTAAKKSRIERSGLTTRIRGHVSARGRRAQGRRDSRG